MSVYQDIQQFHFEQVARGHQTIQKNLESLQNMFRLITTVQKQQIEGNYHDVQYLEAQTPPLLSEQKVSQPDSETANVNSQPNLLEKTENIEDISSSTSQEITPQNSNEVANLELIEQEDKDEDWGEWLEEGEEQDIDVDLLDLSSLDLDESEEWQDWEGEETQLFAGAPATSPEKDQDQ